jgi:hypothetical protein
VSFFTVKIDRPLVFLSAFTAARVPWSSGSIQKEILVPYYRILCTAYVLMNVRLANSLFVGEDARFTGMM